MPHPLYFDFVNGNKFKCFSNLHDLIIPKPHIKKHYVAMNPKDALCQEVGAGLNVKTEITPLGDMNMPEYYTGYFKTSLLSI